MSTVCPFLPLLGVRTKQILMNRCELPEVCDASKIVSRCKDMAAVRKEAAWVVPAPLAASRRPMSTRSARRSATMIPPLAAGGEGSGMDEYAVAEATINQQQSRRMVKKVVAMNKLESK